MGPCSTPDAALALDEGKRGDTALQGLYGFVGDACALMSTCLISARLRFRIFARPSMPKQESGERHMNASASLACTCLELQQR